jgi:hypothetical protein
MKAVAGEAPRDRKRIALHAELDALVFEEE